MNTSRLSDYGRMFQHAQTTMRRQEDAERRSSGQGEHDTLHAPDAGHLLSVAYEQLRNASENIEDHLLFQRAILRFYRRNISFTLKRPLGMIGQELVIELTQAEYLKNDTVKNTTIKEITGMVETYYDAYWKLVKGKSIDDRARITKWTLETLSVRTEQLFNPPLRILAFAHIAHAHFLPLLDIENVTDDKETIASADRQLVLYIGVHKALLKSDDANVRVALQNLYGIDVTDQKAFSKFNSNYDKLSGLKTTAKVSRIVSRNGAPMRMLRSTYFRNETEKNEAADLSHRSKTLSTIEQQIDDEYGQMKHRLRIGVVRSIVFLLLTKAVIGLLVEIPYDILMHGGIVWLPLWINLLFPPLFIAMTVLTYRLPGESNKKALVNYIDAMFYSDTPVPPLKHMKRSSPVVFQAMYALMFIFAFAAIGYVLMLLQFNIVQGVIFFIFLSTASFLGYRLTQQAKELEIIGSEQGFLMALRDFFYAPFIFVGQRISYRFARMNIIAQILDTMIELPLKTTMRLFRQWTSFLSNKNDELL